MFVVLLDLCIILIREMSKIGGLIVKKLFVLVTLVLCGAAIIIGNLHWNQKISAHGEKVANIEEVTEVSEEPAKGEAEDDVSTYSRNLPAGLQEKVINATRSDEPVKLIIYGTSDKVGTWSERFKDELISTYGEDVFQITVLSTGEQNTYEIVNEESYLEINELEPDVLLFEAPMLKDNGVVGIDNTFNNLETMLNSWKEANEELTIMIQPPNPLYAAKNYPREVQALQDYAKENKYIYLNHWENWPELDNVEMEKYLTKDNKANESGNKVWAEYLLDYFVAK